MTLGHWVGPIPYEMAPEYKDADILKVLKRLADRHREYYAEETDNNG